MTLVSVIVPVYERRHCVMEAVESVLAQTHRDVECIVVDDGSSDGAFDAVEAAYADDARVRVFEQPHQGVSAARNLGLREARGEYVTFLDSDDLMPESRITRQVELLTERACDAVLGKAASYAMPGVDAPAWIHARPEWVNGYAWITVLVALRHVRSVGGFDEALHKAEDIDLLVKLRGQASGSSRSTTPLSCAGSSATTSRTASARMARASGIRSAAMSHGNAPPMPEISSM